MVRAGLAGRRAVMSSRVRSAIRGLATFYGTIERPARGALPGSLRVEQTSGLQRPSGPGTATHGGRGSSLPTSAKFPLVSASGPRSTLRACP